MDWLSYVKDVLNKKDSLANLSITVSENSSECINTPAIIKMSIELLCKLFVANEKRVIMVFPEKNHSSFLLVVLKTIFDIFEDATAKTYNPNLFLKGQRLKCGNCVVEFDSVEIANGKTMIWINTADNFRDGIPMEVAPYFQLVNTHRRLSKSNEFLKVKSAIQKKKESMSETEQLIATLVDYRTHINSSVFYVAPIGNTKEMISGTKINNVAIIDLMMVGQAFREGEIEIINRGQLSGEPAIILAADLYSVFNAIKKESDVKSIIIDVSNPNIINNSLDVLDELLQIDLPVICLSDTSNSFEFEQLESRGFIVWRWDEESILSEMFTDISVNAVTMGKKIENCVKHSIEYVKCYEESISEPLAILYKYRQEIAETNLNMLNTYDKLFSLAFFCLRTISVVESGKLQKIHDDINSCRVILQKEKRFITNEMFEEFSKIILFYDHLFDKQFEIPKVTALRAFILDNLEKTICVVIPDKSDKDGIKEFWANECTRYGIDSTLLFMRQSEYCINENIDCNVTVVCGWLNNTIMRKIIYSYNTSIYVVLLYDYEQKWQSPHVKSWNRVLFKADKRKVIEKAFGKSQIDASNFKYHGEVGSKEQPIIDELNEIEMVLRDNKYRRYLFNGGNKNIEETVFAIPINFVGGSFSFYKISHKLISVTEIVTGDSKEIQSTYPDQLQVGDFIVVREAKKDLIREVADIILGNSGVIGLREIAVKWRDALTIENVFSNFDDIFLRLKNAGCTKNQFTVKQWMKNEDIIAPQSKYDLKYIAEVTGDNVLLEKLEEIFEAGKKVKRAHILAGIHLSHLLEKKIATKIQELGEIDLYNIWEPIELYLDDIGNVKVLKIIDIGDKMLVDAALTNCLLTED